MKNLILAALLALSGCASVDRFMAESNTRPYNGRDLLVPVLVLHLTQNEAGGDMKWHNWQTLSVINPFPQAIKVELDCKVFDHKFEVPARSERFLMTEGDPVRMYEKGCRMVDWERIANVE